MKYIRVIILCSLLFYDTLNPFYKSHHIRHISELVRYHLERTNVLFLSIYCIQWIWYQSELRITHLSFHHIASTFLVFSLCFLTYIPSVASYHSHYIILQLFFYLFSIFHLSFWFAIYNSFASRSKYYRFYFIMGFLSVLFIKLNERLYVFQMPSLTEVPKISPFVNLAYAPINYLIGLNLFIGDHDHYLTGLLLFLIYILLIDMLLICCYRTCSPKS